ncbi:MAG: alpha-ketoglutarate-dependent dioxygenase AlkB [Actinobacteria bacterium]|nr:alpha-ketoglutarate-dependent dioxygenase AlkB [Actinomycetota bacterium]
MAGSAEPTSAPPGAPSAAAEPVPPEPPDIGLAPQPAPPPAVRSGPAPGAGRIWLDDRSWVDVSRGWLGRAAIVYDALVEQVAWRQSRVFRYERWVDEPRLSAWCDPGRGALAHPVLLDVHRAVRAAYKPFGGFGMAWYRDERDGVAWHRDRDLRWTEDTVVALLVLGARRPFLLRPRSNRFDHGAPAGGAVHDLAPGDGDLIVLGGRAQADWEHSVPKLAHRVGGRISLQWRWTSRAGRPERGAGYSAPRTFSSR